jgi:alkaline phosphatase D
MDFHDPVRGQRFSYRDREAVGDGTWYGGTPIWTLAERAGIRTAAYFWVGTEAEIGGKRPTWWHLYDDKITHQQRVDQVAEWLAMPAGRRPRLVLLYFADVDTAAHRHGPGSAEAREALLRVDASMGQLLRRIRLPLNVILVSDHGLLKVDGAVRVEDFADLSGFTVTRSSNLIGLYSRDGALIQRTHQKLKGASKAFEVYRRGELPEHLHFRDHVRIPDLMIMSTGKQKLSNSTAPGAHGWDPRAFPEMRGTFLGAGPSIRKGVTLEPVENIHVFPLLAHLLGLPVPKGIDGRLEPMRAILRH